MNYVQGREHICCFAQDLWAYAIWVYAFSSPRAKRRGRKGLRAESLGLLLADGAPTMGWGKTFRCIGPFFLRKRSFIWNEGWKNRSEAEGYKQALTKSKVLERIFGPKRENSLLCRNHVLATIGQSCAKKKVPFSLFALSLGFILCIYSS